MREFDVTRKAHLSQVRGVVEHPVGLYNGSLLTRPNRGALLAMDKRQVLRSIAFGHRVAEDETDVLATYFVETDHWQRLYRGDIDIVYGPKGSGKSALYSLLLSKSTELFDRSILLVAGENPRGATAFRDLMTDPPASEREFVGLWKLYIASLVHSALAEYGIKNDSTKGLD
jgi:hypothetical protein